MKNFRSVRRNIDALKKGDVIKDKLGNLKPSSNSSHFVATHMYKYRIDKKNDVYVLPGVGAFVENVDVRISSVKDLEKYANKRNNLNPYQYILNLVDKGYQLVVGKPFPNFGGYFNEKIETGIYCKNYLEIAEKERRLEKLRKEREKLKSSENRTGETLTF